jgi:putative DNA primase/helicase
VCDYASRGWPVFPCDDQKRPKTRNGFKDATTDVDQLRTHWAENPDDLIGIATGNGLVVIDDDSYKSEQGAPEWREFVSSHGGLPRTYTVKTGRGGTHYYFSVAGPVRSTTSLFPHVDVRGDGGYVIAAPSSTIFGTYEVLPTEGGATWSGKVAPAPAWLLEKLQPKEVEISSASREVVSRDAMSEAEKARCDHYAETVFELEVARLRECAQAAVSNFGRDVYTGPDWNSTTYEVACNLLEIAYSPWNALTEGDAYDTLAKHAPRDSGFGLAEILERWDSARKKVNGAGRPMPRAQTGMFVPFPEGVADPEKIYDPDAYFGGKGGLIVTKLALDLLELGDLAMDDSDNRSIWSYRNGVWHRAPHEVSDRCTVLLGHKFRPSHVSTVLPMLQQLLRSRGAIITCDPVPEYLNVLNGMLFWKTGTLYPHDPSFYSTVQLPVTWDEDAVCPLFDRFVDQVMAPDAHAYLWEILGYLAYSGNPLQRAFLFHGAGSNGKGTLIRVIKALLGASNTSQVTLQDIAEGKFEVASLFGKIANLAGDIDPAYMKSTARFKAITGEDTIEAQRKYEHPFAFTCWAVPVFSANEFWKSADTTHGYRRRWQLLTFPNTFDTKAGLSEDLTSELPGILAHAVRSLRELMARGNFDTPKSAQDEKDRFELAADQVREWVTEDDRLAIRDPDRIDVRMLKKEAYTHYKRWTEATGNGTLPLTKWWQRMQALGYSSYMYGGLAAVRGLSLGLPNE